MRSLLHVLTITTEMSETIRIHSDYYAKLFVLKFENYINQTISAQEFGLFLDEYNAFLDSLTSKLSKK
jgi:hypothetical protein